MCFRKSKLPRKSGIMDRTSRCSSCTSVITGDQNQSGSCFCNTRCNRSDTGFRYQFDRNSCILVCIFTVIDQLCQIFDRVNIVMRRRWDQSHTRRRMSGFCYPRVNLSPRQMSTFSRFCSLRHLDLDFFCADKISACNTKTSTGNLFDRRASVGSKALDILSAFTGVWLTVQCIHCKGKGFVCFLWNWSVRHCTGLKSGHDRIHTLYFWKRNSFLWIIEVHLSTECDSFGFFINHLRVLLEHFIIPASCGLLEHMDRSRVVQMLFTTALRLVLSHTVQRQIYGKSQRIKGLGMPCHIIFCNFFQSDTTDTADSSGEIFFNEFRF